MKIFSFLLCLVFVQQLCVGQDSANNSIAEQPATQVANKEVKDLPESLSNSLIPDGYTNPNTYKFTISAGESFQVPEGSNFYIVQIELHPASYYGQDNAIKINDTPILRFNTGVNFCGEKVKKLKTPILVGANTKLSIEGKGASYDVEGFTTEAKVAPVVIAKGEDFVVPANRTFVLMHSVSSQTCEEAFAGIFTFDVLEYKNRHFPKFYTEGTSVREVLQREEVLLGYLF